MKEEYDIRGGVRGKYAKEYAEGVTVTVLTPEFRLTPEQAIGGAEAFYKRLAPVVPPPACSMHPRPCSPEKHAQIVQGVPGFPDWLNFLAALAMTVPGSTGVHCRCCWNMLRMY